MILTKMNLYVTEEGLERDEYKDKSDESFINTKSSGYVTHRQKEKVMNSIQSIADILRNHREFQRAMEVFGESLQMHMAMSALNQHPNGNIGISRTIYGCY